MGLAKRLIGPGRFPRPGRPESPDMPPLRQIASSLGKEQHFAPTASASVLVKRSRRLPRIDDGRSALDLGHRCRRGRHTAPTGCRIQAWCGSESMSLVAAQVPQRPVTARVAPRRTSGSISQLARTWPSAPSRRNGAWRRLVIFLVAGRIQRRLTALRRSQRDLGAGVDERVEFNQANSSSQKPVWAAGGRACRGR